MWIVVVSLLVYLSFFLFSPVLRHYFSHWTNWQKIECLLYIYALKINYPKSVYILRGNHECRIIARHFNFWSECLYKYTDGLIFLSFFSSLSPSLPLSLFLLLPLSLSPSLPLSSPPSLPLSLSPSFFSSLFLLLPLSLFLLCPLSLFLFA